MYLLREWVIFLQVGLHLMYHHREIMTLVTTKITMKIIMEEDTSQLRSRNGKYLLLIRIIKHLHLIVMLHLEMLDTMNIKAMLIHGKIVDDLQGKRLHTELTITQILE